MIFIFYKSGISRDDAVVEVIRAKHNHLPVMPGTDRASDTTYFTA